MVLSFKTTRASGYSPREIDAWAAKIRAWQQGGEPTAARRIGGPAKPATKGRDVYVFFDNTDVKLRAPVDARRMAKVLGIGPRENARRILADLGIKRSVQSCKRARRKAGR